MLSWSTGEDLAVAWGMKQSKASQKGRKVEMGFFEDYVMSAQLLRKEKGEANRPDVVKMLVYKKWSVGHGAWWPCMGQGAHTGL